MKQYIKGCGAGNTPYKIAEKAKKSYFAGSKKIIYIKFITFHT